MKPCSCHNLVLLAAAILPCHEARRSISSFVSGDNQLTTLYTSNHSANLTRGNATLGKHSGKTHAEKYSTNVTANSTQGLGEEVPTGANAEIVAKSTCGKDTGSTGKGSAGCLVIKDGAVLMMTSGYFEPSGSWDLPGGHADGDELSCQAAERELCEETPFQGKATGKTSVAHIFICEFSGDSECQPGPEGRTETKWVTAEEFASISLREGGIVVKSVVEEALGGSSGGNTPDSADGDKDGGESPVGDDAGGVVPS